jgi:hypothetical protein
LLAHSVNPSQVFPWQVNLKVHLTLHPHSSWRQKTPILCMNPEWRD